ncbi:GroES-like protein [Lentinus tigrinus ALCF2SS1-7]|uniref:GroES-like protein n=1 Tax=Lentinus tigrinus ALCF2SS1-7 TaxID=1328758 RepID=UPI0011663B89|nr:GroES-like protein [Lentinus tigrinus ALCF2SS1-7]
MAPTTQKILGSPSQGAPWEIYNDWPVPALGPKDVLLKVVAASLNPADWGIQSSPTQPPMVTAYPFIGGLDGAGVVEEVGAEVTNVAKGDKVVFPGGFEQERATFKQYTIASAANVAKIPDNISFEEAASIPVALATVAAGMWAKEPGASSVGFPAPWEEGGLTKFKGQAALIAGGSSSVGQYAIQMAKLQGFSPIIVTSSLKHADYLKSLGATHILDRSLPSASVLAELPKLTGGAPIVYAFDAISSPETQHLAYDSLAPEGAMITTHPFSVAILAEKEKRDGGSRKVARPYASLRLPGNLKLGAELYARLTEWLEKGLLKPNRIEILPNGLAGIPEGLERMKNFQVSGIKLVAHPQETA